MEQKCLSEWPNLPNMDFRRCDARDCPESTAGRNRLRRGYRRHRQETGEGRNAKIQWSPVYAPELPAATLSFSHRDDAGLTLARIRDDVYPDPAPSALLFWTTISFRPCASRGARARLPASFAEEHIKEVSL